MVIRDKTYTVDEYYMLMEARQDDKRFELVEGYMVEMPPPRWINSRIARQIAMYLGLYVEENDLGDVLGADGGYVLSPGDVRIPDVSFIAQDRIPEELPKNPNGSPDLAVEVISPSETAGSINEKTRLYLETGAQVVWIIYPDEEFAEIRTLADNGFHVETVDKNGVLTAKSVLPDFELPMSKLFPTSTTEA